MTQTYFDPHYDMVAALAGRVIDLRTLEQKATDELHMGLRFMADAGHSVDEISSASGLTPTHVRRILEMVC